MLRRTLIPSISLIALLASSSGHAQDLASVERRPSHYTVRFGAMVGELEPIAGEMLCDRDRDCEILLAFVPEITVRLRADPDNVRHGQASIDCADLQCVFDIESREIPYSSKVNDLRIWTGQGNPRGKSVPAVWHPRTQLGRITVVIDP